MNIAVLVMTGNRNLKPEMDTQLNKNYIFSETEGLADYKNILKKNRSKVRIFCKSMQILQISVRHLKYLMNCDLKKNNSTAANRTKIKIF